MLQPRRVKAEDWGQYSAVRVSIPTMMLTGLTQAFTILAFLIILNAIWRLLKSTKITRRFLNRTHKPKFGADRSDIYIELSDGTATHLQYLASVAVHGSLICDLPTEIKKHPQIIAHDKHWINDVITIAWGDLETITLTDQDILHLPEKVSVTFKEKYKVRHIVEHAYTIRVIIECGGLLWQISNNLMESRKRQWIENLTTTHANRMFTKDKGEIPLHIKVDKETRQNLLNTHENTITENTDAENTYPTQVKLRHNKITFRRNSLEL